MKLSTIVSYSVSIAFLFSCSQMNASEKRRKVASNTQKTTQKLDDEEIIKKKGAENHELADADADDQDIIDKVGVDELDAELPGSEKDAGIPYSKNFLLKKNTKRMQFWVDYFTKQQRDRFQRFINNGEEYRHHIEKVFQEHGLPKELYFVGLIESGYYLGARSHAAAVGPWQFIKGTGTRYGLKTTNEIDERQDLFKASQAAAMYFKDLHNIFSSWELALSAYNAGENGIIRRIMKHGTRDFYELSRNKHLPSETINYVPKVLAAMHVVNNAEKYGFIIPKKKHHLFDQTELKTVQKNMSLNQLANRLGVSMHLLKKLNPELRRDATPRHFAGSYQLRVPQGQYRYNVEQQPVTEEIAALIPTQARPERRIELTRRIAELKPSVHVVKRGETILSLSRRYKISAKEIAQINGMKNWKTKVQVGQKIALTKEDMTRPAQSVVRSMNRPIVYKVTKGDNLADLARVFNVQVARLKSANKLKRGSIIVGQKIILPDTQKGIYVVKRGDHLTKVARDLNQPMEALIKMNALKRKAIYPGQKIIVNMD